MRRGVSEMEPLSRVPRDRSRDLAKYFTTNVQAIPDVDVIFPMILSSESDSSFRKSPQLQINPNQYP